MLSEEQSAHVLVGVAGLLPEPYRTFDDGGAIWVYAMLFGNGRLCVGHEDDRTGFDRAWCYPSVELAFAAADKWNGTGEPEGWIKNL